MQTQTQTHTHTHTRTYCVITSICKNAEKLSLNSQTASKATTDKKERKTK